MLAAAQSGVGGGLCCAMAGVIIEHSGHALALASAAVISGAALPFCPPSARRRAALAIHDCAAAPVRP